MASHRVSVLFLILPLVATNPWFAGLSHGPQVDREAIRRRLEKPILSADEARQVFEELKKLVLDESASPADRCSDFYRAVNVMSRFDPSAAVQFAEEMDRQKWPREAPPAQHGLFMCGVGIAYLTNRQSDLGYKKLNEITAEEKAANPMVDGISSKALMMAAVAGGKYDEAYRQSKFLYRAAQSTELPVNTRSQFTFDVLQFLFDVGAPQGELDKVIRESAPLLAQSGGEVADRLSVLVNTIRVQTELSTPWPTKQGAIDDRVERLARIGDEVRGKLRTDEPKYGPAAPATILAKQLISTLNLELARFSKDAATLERETISLSDSLLATATPTLLEPERVWAIKGIAAGMLGSSNETRESYEQIKRIQEREGVGPNSGLRFSQRLQILAYLGDRSPAYVAQEWLSGINAFAEHVRGLALQNPDLAISSISAWNPIPMYGSIARKGRPEDFLEGYIQATGIVKNVPYRRQSPQLFGKVGLADVQKRLSPEHPLVSFVRFQDPATSSLPYYGAFLLDGKHARFVDLGPASTVEAAVRNWRQSLRPAMEGGKGDPKAAGARLYRLLLSPLFPGKLPPHLHIVPDAGLELVSFAALQTPGHRWVVEDTAVDYLGAMRDLMAAPDRTSRRSPSAFLQADQYRDHLRLGVASQTLKAMRAVDSHLKANEATSEKLRALRSPTYLHLSVHGDNKATDDPTQLADSSWLLLPGPKPNGRDTAFSAREVAALNLQGTKCVVLAACLAAKSKVLEGDGIGGLRRAFYIAGARSVIASLLLIEESPSSFARRAKGQAGNAPGDELLSKVYAPLAEGKGAAEALRIAQLQLLRSPETSAPRYWAGFICEGG